VLGELYDNEVGFYVRLRPELSIEAPRVIGGVCDKRTARYYLLLEDLSARGAVFPNALRTNTTAEVCAVLEQLARLHAAFWNSPRLRADLRWYQSHVSGSLHDQMEEALQPTIEADMQSNEFKRELVGELGTDIPSLHAAYSRLQQHQASLPQTILHGDGHIGNTYLLPDGRAGLLDWQLTARGAWAHDVSYLIVTALNVEERRREERNLLAHYLEALGRNGLATIPDPQAAWLEYRRALLWSLYVGWLTTPVANYGEALNRVNLTRTATACADHETERLIAAID
jgi:aminoglycoside/choline kinase family phosphotransferase